MRAAGSQGVTVSVSAGMDDKGSSDETGPHIGGILINVSPWVEHHGCRRAGSVAQRQFDYASA